MGIENNIDINDFIHGKCTIKVANTQYEEEIELKLLGKIDFEFPDEVLNPFFEDLHKKFIEKEIRKVYINTTELKFMNSRGLMVIIKWATNVDKMPENNRYQLFIKYNGFAQWQETAFQTIEKLMPKLVSIEGSYRKDLQ